MVSGVKTTRYVLDSFALLVWLADEPGAATVQAILEKARENSAEIFLSWMNIAEVYYITARRCLDSDKELAASRAVELIESLPVQIGSISRSEALAAARFKAGHAISLADAFAAALAEKHEAGLVTGDPEFKSLEKARALQVVWLPSKAR